MSSKQFVATVVILFGLFLFGCIQQGVVIHTPVMGGADDLYYSNTRSFGEQGYYATMKYNPALGTLRIEFSDKYGFPQKLIRKKKVKAVLTIPDEKPREFYLRHPSDRSLPKVHSKQHLSRSLPSTDYVYATDGWLKDISSYNLKIWIPSDSKTYVVEYNHAG